MLELLLITSWATLFSASSAPTTAAAFTMAIYVIGHLADDLWRFGNQSESMMFREFAHAMYWILPNFEIFNLREAAVHETAIPWERVRTSVMYGLSYSAAVLGVAMSVFSRRDIQ